MSDTTTNTVSTADAVLAADYRLFQIALGHLNRDILSVSLATDTIRLDYHYRHFYGRATMVQALFPTHFDAVRDLIVSTRGIYMRKCQKWANDGTPGGVDA